MITATDMLIPTALSYVGCSVYSLADPLYGCLFSLTASISFKAAEIFFNLAGIDPRKHPKLCRTVTDIAAVGVPMSAAIYLEIPLTTVITLLGVLTLASALYRATIRNVVT